MNEGVELVGGRQGGGEGGGVMVVVVHSAIYPASNWQTERLGEQN